MNLEELFTLNNAKRALLATFAICILKWLYGYLYRVWFYWPIPNRIGLPFIGNIHQYRTRKSELMKNFLELSNKFKDSPVFKFWFATEVALHVHKYELLDQIIDDSRLSYKAKDLSLLSPWLGTGLLLSNGDKWFSRRKLITPAFHFDILKDFMSVFNEQSEILVQNLKAMSKEPVCLLPYLSSCALDIICVFQDTAMGQHVNAQNDMDSDYVKAIHQMCEVFVDRFVNPLFRLDFIFQLTNIAKKQRAALNVLHSFTKKVIMERKENFQGLFSKSSKRIAFLDILLDAHMKNPQAINLDDIQEEVDTFMFEGHDTTATALNFTTYLIATHPEVQDKLHKEIEDTFGNSNRLVTTDDLNKLKYLECVIKESLRIFPPVAVITRRPIEDTMIGPYKVLKNCRILVHIIQINRDERCFPEPLKFKPERFLPENSVDRHPYCYIPFSAGRRNCIGQKFAMMEMKVILANMLRNFELSCNQTMEELKLYNEIILRTENKIMVSLKPKYQ